MPSSAFTNCLFPIKVPRTDGLTAAGVQGRWAPPSPPRSYFTLGTCAFWGKPCRVWNPTAQHGYFKADKSRCAAAPPGSRYPGGKPLDAHRGDGGERAGSGRSGRVFAQAATDSRGGDVAGATPAASLTPALARAQTNTGSARKHARALSRQHQASYPQQHQALI